MAESNNLLKKLARQIHALEKENRYLKQSLQKFEKRTVLFQNLIEYGVDAIFCGDSAGNIIYANQRAATLTGYSNSELLSMRMSQLFSPEERQRAPLKYDRLRQGKTVITERLLTRGNGTTVPIEMNSRMMPDGTYHSFFRDISERKEADKALRVSEEKFSRVFQLSPDVIVLSRLEDGLYLEVNRGFTETLGWTPEEAVGHRTDPGDLDIWCNLEDREKMISGLVAHGEITDLQAEFKHKDGHVVIGLMSARIIDIDETPCVLSVARNITERVRAREKKIAFEKQMLQAQKLESLGVLAGGIAHDFNNILTAVIGHCELAQQRLSAESPAMENLRQINIAAGRAADLANQMLAYSGKGKFVIEPLNISRIIEEMAHILSVSVSKKAIVRYDLARDLPSVEADATQMRQIIMNLVINGSDAIGDENGVIAISTGIMECDRSYLRNVQLEADLSPGRYVFFEVADTGCGMTSETMQRIFEPFFSTKFTGRGLGMAAVLGIVRSHGGAIKIYSEVNKGSTFKVLLPSSKLTAVQNETVPETISLCGSGLVLLVEDEEIVRDISKAMLQDFGFEILTAHDGKEAVTVFRKHHRNIRFVLMDLTMPYMDGEEAYRELRRIDPGVKVIICSGYNEQDVSQKFVGKGLAGFLKKPYQIQELQKMIRHILED
ncbi:hybrid sensor histidine kinase/response regulator [Desulfomarina sp.]